MKLGLILEVLLYIFRLSCSTQVAFPNKNETKHFSATEFHVRGWWCLFAHWRCLRHVAGSQAGHSLCGPGLRLRPASFILSCGCTHWNQHTNVAKAQGLLDTWAAGPVKNRCFYLVLLQQLLFYSVSLILVFLSVVISGSHCSSWNAW